VCRHPAYLHVPSCLTLSRPLGCARLSQHEWRELAALECLPPGTTAADYVANLATELVLSPVSSRLAALRSGFRSVLPPVWLEGLDVRPGELQLLLRGYERPGAGGADFSWREVFRVQEDEELVAPEAAPLRSALWGLLEDGLTVPEKRKMLVFLTGVGQLPAPQTETLVIEMPFEWSEHTHLPLSPHTHARHVYVARAGHVNGGYLTVRR